MASVARCSAYFGAELALNAHDIRGFKIRALQRSGDRALESPEITVALDSILHTSDFAPPLHRARLVRSLFHAIVLNIPYGILPTCAAATCHEISQ